MLKYFVGIILTISSLASIAQSTVVKCTLETTYTRDGVKEGAFSGVFCNDCLIAIRTLDDGRTLYLDGLSHFSQVEWTKSDDKLDINGYGGRASWSINGEEVSASEEIYAGGKRDGYASLTISRLTGNYRSIRRTSNPMGRGNIEVITIGVCQLAKAAF